MEQIHVTLDDHFARCTWIVPIRGTPPWQDCSSAVILREGTCSSEETKGEGVKLDPDIPPATMSEIIWTRAAVRAFWQFLLELRASKNVGPIALSFHAASANRAVTKTTAPANNTCTITSTDSKSQKRGVAPTLLDMDHIKVYHDARCAVHLRNVFHAWSYRHFEDGSGTGRNTSTATADDNAFTAVVEHHVTVKSKVRPLKNVKLALLDERSQAILVC